MMTYIVCYLYAGLLYLVAFYPLYADMTDAVLRANLRNEGDDPKAREELKTQLRQSYPYRFHFFGVLGVLFLPHSLLLCRVILSVILSRRR